MNLNLRYVCPHEIRGPGDLVGFLAYGSDSGLGMVLSLIPDKTVTILWSTVPRFSWWLSEQLVIYEIAPLCPLLSRVPDRGTSYD